MSPQQQEFFRKQQIAKQNLELLQKEQMRQNMETKRQQELTIKKIEEEFDQRNAEERSHGTMSANIEKTINSFYSRGKKDTDSTESSEKPKKRAGKRK